MSNNPFAAKTGAAANPFAAAAKPAAANPFAAAGAPAPAPAAAGTAANPFAAAAKPANPFAAGGTAAAANPFAAKSANPFATAAGSNPFAKGGATTGAASGTAAPAITIDPQDQVILSGLHTLVSRITGQAEETDVLNRVRQLLDPYLKLTVHNYAFRAIAYNVRDPSAGPSPLLTPEEWDRETTEHRYDEECNPRMEIMPVVLDGFTGLKARVEEQDKAIKLYMEHCGKLLSAVQTVEIACERSRDRLERIRASQAGLAHRLLSVAGKVDAVVLRGKPEHMDEVRLRGLLTSLKAYVLEDGRVKERIDQLVLALHSRREAGGMQVSGGRGGLVLEERDMMALVRQLSIHCRGIEQVIGILRKDVRDLEIIKMKVKEARERQRVKDVEARRHGAMYGLGLN